MAAPETAYLSQAIKIDGTESTYIAKFLQNTTPTSGDEWGDGYFNSGDSDATKKSKILSIFKLHDFFRITSDTEDGFVGIVKLGSPEAEYHNVSRHGMAEITDDSQNEYVALNDAGLNTKGDCSIVSILANTSTSASDSIATYPPRINNAVAWALFKSSFYNGTTNMVVQMKNDADVWTQAQDLGTQGVKARNTLKTAVIQDNLLETIGTKYFRAIITNSEGSTTSEEFQAAIKRAMATMKYNSLYASYAYNGSTTTTIYYDSRIIRSLQGGGEATTFAKNDVIEMTASDIADVGYYTLGDTWYEFKYYEPEDVYVVTRLGLCAAWAWPTDDPAYRFNPVFYTTIQYQFEEATLTVTSSTLTITPNTQDNTTTPPSFPSATYSISLNSYIAKQNTTVYFYIQTESAGLYYLGSDTTGDTNGKTFNFSGSFSTLGLLPYAGDQYYVLISDMML